MRIVKWILVGCVGLLIVGYALTRPLEDFVEYWSSAHEVTSGKDPYSLTEILRLERALGWSKASTLLPSDAIRTLPTPIPLMNLNPPWALPLIAPLGFIKTYVAGWLLWIGVLIVMLWWSTRLLLTLYSCGRPIFQGESYASEAILGFTFIPCLICLKFAQITPIVLLGIASFLWFENRRRDTLAGACLALAAIKPQLTFLIWLGLPLWCWRRRRMRPLLSLASTIALLTAVAALMRPTVIADYLLLLRSGYAQVWPCALGAILRYPFGTTASFPLQFVGATVGAIWFIFYWYKHRDTWDWLEQMPLLITASVLAAPYGWTFDQVLLVVPIVAVAARRANAGRRFQETILVTYTILNVALIYAWELTPRISFVLAPIVLVSVLLKLQSANSGVDCRVRGLTVL